jgi:transposase-like protein
MARKHRAQDDGHGGEDRSLATFACPNPDCDDFNRFNGGNLSVVEWTGKHQHIRRLYCKSCGQRFSERRGTLMRYTKLPEETVVRIIKCLGHGCSIEATADICEVDPRTVEQLLEKAGRRAEDFHRLHLEKLQQPLEAVELDELHGRVSPTPAKKGGAASGPRTTRLGRVAAWVACGFMRRWRSSVAS